MSPKQGRRPTPGKRGSGSAGDHQVGRAEVRRFGLFVFGVSFVLLFAIVAIAGGVGHPSVPEGAVAYVEDAPGDTGTITNAEFDHALEQAAAAAQEQKAPKPGTPRYEELKETAMNALFESVWLQGVADEMGITATDEEVADEKKELKKQSFRNEAEFKKFLKEAKYTQADVDERVKLQVLAGKLQTELAGGAPKPSDGEIEAYYEAAKDTQFTKPPSRTARQIKSKDREKAQRAKEALAKDDSAENWERVAKRYSEDAATKENGGLQEGVTEGTLGEPLDAAVFNAPEGELEGPLKSQGSFYVFEVEGSTPEETQPLDEVESQIESTLAQQAEQEYFTGFVEDFNSKWTSRTFCADGYVVERCANFEGDGRPATAPEACYEEDPEGGPPEACPAPVFQAVPALPGSVTPLEPRGEPKPQRPIPAGSEQGEEALTPESFPPPAE